MQNKVDASRFYFRDVSSISFAVREEDDSVQLWFHVSETKKFVFELYGNGDWVFWRIDENNKWIRLGTVHPTH